MAEGGPEFPAPFRAGVVRKANFACLSRFQGRCLSKCYAGVLGMFDRSLDP